MVIRTLSAALLAALSAVAQVEPAWRALPERAPIGHVSNTGAHVIGKGQPVEWTRPPFRYDERVATGRKRSNVLVVIYDPVLEAEGGKRLTEHVGANDPYEFSRILADVILQASWGYIDYEIVDFVRIDGFPTKVDGFCYTDESFLAARAKQEWQPAPSAYRGVIEDNGLLERIRRDDVREIWLWGASGMHFDEFAGYIPNRYARYGPTDNPWLYRPYDIPPELDKTFWVMGFNYEVGADNMIHSYTHRVESMAALAYADGTWDPSTRRDPWNVFSWLEMDHEGTPSMVGNCHVPPNGQQGYDYANPRTVPSFADRWERFPDLRGDPVATSAERWGRTQFGYQKWILERLPKGPGATEHGYNNWWVHIANTDEDLPEWTAPDPSRFVLPAGMPAAGEK